MGWLKFVGPAASLVLAGLTAFNDPIQQVIVEKIEETLRKEVQERLRLVGRTFKV